MIPRRERKLIAVLFGWFLVLVTIHSALAQTNRDLVTPKMISGSPAAGRRVRQVAPEFVGTEVYHSLYLPTDWKPNGRHPVIVEYTGNRFPTSGSTGEVKDANLGFGLSGGTRCIWLVMPYIAKNLRQNETLWWGDLKATTDYCKTNLPRICDQFGGDRENVILCGFSRGAIATSYIGLADDDIAKLWKGFFAHDHFDGERKWNYEHSDRASALRRLKRLNGRPVLISGTNASNVRKNFLAQHLELAKFTFLDVPTDKIFRLPEGPYVHPHMDLWMHRDSEYCKRARAWLNSTLDDDVQQ